MQALPCLPSSTVCTWLAAAAGLALLARRTRVFACALAGFALTAVSAHAGLAHRLPATLGGRDFAVTGWVDDFPSIGQQSTTFSLRVEAVRGDALPLERLRLTWYDDAPELRPGASLDLVVRLRPPRGLRNPGGFDYERWLFLEAYSATGYVRRGRIADEPAGRWAARWLALRGRLARHISASARTAESGALLAALAIGDRSGFSEQLWSDLRRTGTSHLVAISGLHIGLVAGFCYLLAGALARRAGSVAASYDIEVAAITAAVAAFAYAALGGFSLPTQRALLMCVFALIVVASRRYANRLDGLAIALSAVLVIDPLASLTASFWMSFAAAAVLLVVSGRGLASPVPPRQPQWQRWLWRMLETQCLLTAALAPFVIGFFAQFSVPALLVNILAIPVFCFVLVPATLAATVAGSVAPPLWAAMRALGVVADGILAALHWVAEWHWAAFQLPGAGAAATALAALGAILALPWHACPGRRLCWLALVPVLWPVSPGPAPGNVSVVVLDVGHGLAAIVETSRHRLVYDAGPVSRSGFDTGRELVLPALRRRPRFGLDKLIVSHSDNDHIGGAPSVLEAYPRVAVLHGPDVSTLDGADCKAGQRWRWDGVDFLIVHPPASFESQGNDSSCVLKITGARGSLLLTGDIEARGERELALRRDLDVDVVIVPHHGSATSSTPLFVNALKPEAALVSAGYNNRWGFPRPEVAMRWREAGARVYVTGELGALHVSWPRGELEVWGERQRHRRYWQAAIKRIPG